MLCGCGATEESEGARRVTGGGPAGTAVEPHAFVCDNSEDAAAAEGFGVGLAFDFQDVEGEEDDFADADQAVQTRSASFGPNSRMRGKTPSSSRVHDRLPVAFPKCSVELVSVV